MPRLNIVRVVPRLRTEVFAYTADFSNSSKWDPGVTASKRLDEGPLKVGSTFDLMVKFGSQVLPMTYKIIAIEPESRVTFEGVNSKLVAIDDIKFTDAEGGGTRIEYSADFQFKGLLWLAAPFMTGLLNKVGEDALNGLASKFQ
eukprot:jgi/Mesvir1/1784/Mv15215-RA.1